MKLYELTDEWSRIYEVLADTGGELTEEIDQEMAALLGASTDKLEAATRVLRCIDADADLAEAAAKIAEAEADRLKGRAKALSGNAGRLKALMLPLLDQMGGKVKTAIGTLYVRKNTAYTFAVTPGTEWHDLPSAFVRYRDPELNLLELRKAVKEGQVPEGVACESTETRSLCVR